MKDKEKPYVVRDFKDIEAGSVSPYNNDHVYLGKNKNNSSKLFIECTKCRQDIEQYVDGIFEVTPFSFKKGTCCYCSPSGLKPTEEMYKIRTKRLCGEYGYTFKGFVGDVVNSGTKLRLVCDKGHETATTSLSKFLTCGRKCGVCANNYKREYVEAEVLSRIISVRGNKYTYKGLGNLVNSKSKFKAVCEKHGEWETDLYHHLTRKQDCPHEGCSFNKISEVKASNTRDFIEKANKIHGEMYDYSDTVYVRATKKVTIHCNTCERPYVSVAADHLRGNGCNLCVTDNQKQIYVFLVSEEGIPIAIKTGKAVNYKTRLSKQGRLSAYTVDLIGLWVTDSYEDCKRVEDYLNLNFKGNYLEKVYYPDGYTETRNLLLLEDILYYLDNNCKREI